MEDYRTTCMICKGTFTDPVIASDGQTYDYDCLKTWYKKHQTSPHNMSPIKSEVYTNHGMCDQLEIPMTKATTRDLSNIIVPTFVSEVSNNYGRNRMFILSVERFIGRYNSIILPHTIPVYIEYLTSLGKIYEICHDDQEMRNFLDSVLIQFKEIPIMRYDLTHFNDLELKDEFRTPFFHLADIWFRERYDSTPVNSSFKEYIDVLSHYMSEKSLTDEDNAWEPKVFRTMRVYYRLTTHYLGRHSTICKLQKYGFDISKITEEKLPEYATLATLLL